MRNQFIDFVALLGVLGIPTIFSMTMYCINACRTFSKQLTTLMESQKAQMRAQLLKDYKRYYAQGFVDVDELTEWINSYKQYETLPGANEVLDAKKEELLKLPNSGAI